MTTKSLLILGSCLIACCLIMGRSFGDAPAQPQAGQTIPGRYQVVSGSHGTGDFHLVLLDSATGRSWLKRFRFTGSSDGAWEDQGSPAERPVRK
jgi:hypothetical protein